MLKSIYKQILVKLDLDEKQLQELRDKLSPNNICIPAFNN